jgi:hypothetical protein
VVEHPRFFLREDHDAPGAIREPLEHLTRPSDRSPRRSALRLEDQGSHVLPPRYFGRRGLAPAPARPRVYPWPSERLEPWSRRPCSIIPSVASPSRISTKRYAGEA